MIRFTDLRVARNNDDVTQHLSSYKYFKRRNKLGSVVLASNMAI